MSFRNRRRDDPFRVGDVIVNPRSGEMERVVKIDRLAKLVQFESGDFDTWRHCEPPKYWADAYGHGEITYQ